MKNLLLFAVLLLLAPMAFCQTVIRTTPYTRGLLTNSTAAAARTYLGVSAGGGTVGTMLNVGTPEVGATPRHTDVSGTNTEPSLLIVDGSGNVTMPGVLRADSAIFTNGITSLQAGASTFDAVTVTNEATFLGAVTMSFDAAATGNVLKQTKYILFQRPDYGDGVGAIPQTNAYTASGLMHYTFSGTAETNANWAVYEADVPPDIDTAVAMTATIAFVSGGTDADDVTFHITYALGAAGTALPSGTAIATAPIVMTVTPTTPASGDVQTTAAVTLTGWAASMAAGTPFFIRVARLNTANDDSARDMYLRIAYGSIQ